MRVDTEKSIFGEGKQLTIWYMFRWNKHYSFNIYTNISWGGVIFVLYIVSLIVALVCFDGPFTSI